MSSTNNIFLVSISIQEDLKYIFVCLFYFIFHVRQQHLYVFDISLVFVFVFELYSNYGILKSKINNISNKTQSCVFYIFIQILCKFKSIKKLSVIIKYLVRINIKLVFGYGYLIRSCIKTIQKLTHVVILLVN